MKTMKIGIHYSGLGTFSERWIACCIEEGIEYKIVNAYDNEIIRDLEDCDCFMWHHDHGSYKDLLMAKQLIYSLEQSGKKVFPNYKTTWHFDDKIGQKYLLESIGAPLVNTYVLLSKSLALRWAERTTFPKVFKLRVGAGSANVRKVETKKDAVLLIKRAFSRGFKPFNHLAQSRENLRNYKLGKSTLRNVIRPLYYILNCPNSIRMRHIEKGYVYFQDFIPNNSFDIRVIVINERAFAIKRLVRNKDFRASGSGSIIYDKEEIDERCVSISFEVNRKIESQCIAFDFVFDESHNPMIVEISYGFSPSGYDACQGYWDSNMIWHDGRVNPYSWMVHDLINIGVR